MTTKPEVLSRIEATFSQLTPSEKRVASWMLAHAAQIPFETAESVALATGTSGITVGRFLRKLGFRNLDDAKNSLRDPYQPWGMNERLDSWQQQQPLSDRVQHSLSLEVDAVCGTVTVETWDESFSESAQIRYHQHYQNREGHRHIHGANLGISAEAYRLAGGFEPLACDEDVQLVRQLERCGATIAWSHRPQVLTSARLDSRARGGFGDYLRDLVQTG